MSAKGRGFGYRVLLLGWLWLMTALMSPTALGQQCFNDAQAAYAAMIAAEREVEQARQYSQDNAWVNINTATEGELTTLTGVGSSKAQAIILYREVFGDFESIADITKVKGIGDKTFEKNKHRLRVR